MAKVFPADLASVRAEDLEAAFEETPPLTVGIEEEVMLVDPDTLDLVPRAAEVLARLDGDPRFKPELPASQLEILTEPVADAAEAVGALAGGRRDLAAAAASVALPLTVGVHPFAAGDGELAPGERYERTAERYGRIARRQLVAALQVHVAVGGAARTLAVYNALRSHLPELAALAANAPFYAGEDSGLASVRPAIATLLPRQGVPPALESWERFAAELRWGAATGAVTEPRLWWWELRPHPTFGTLEVRVPDSQTTIAEATGIVATVQALVAWLAARHDAGERLGAAPTWRIEENRFSALSRGVEGGMANLETGALEPTRERLRRLLDLLEPVADRLGTGPLLAGARPLVEVNGAIRQRDLARDRDLRAMTATLAERFSATERGTRGA
ncbi:MAG TPA: YbdK family carboxylate-amine ligase [Solirubrobacterales bacterium]|nr:YbdK family carboxylate-amine ligase [Solirubrobacterales bacterium]